MRKSVDSPDASWVALCYPLPSPGARPVGSHARALCSTGPIKQEPSNKGRSSQASESMSETVFTTARNYLDLTKPRLLPMVLFTGLPVLGMAAGGWPSFSFSLLVITGIALAAASANTLNAYIERDLDARMERTKTRPLPSGLIEPKAALVFGIALAVASTLLLAWVSGMPAALVGVASILFYVFIYTVWLKPRSIWNAVIGGAAGAAAPLIADAAVNGSIGVAGWTLFAIVFFWQPPHVWAIALYRKSDYKAAGIPMPPEVIGDEATRRRVVAYTAGLLPVTLAPFFLGLVGPIYFSVACPMGLWFLYRAYRLFEERTDDAARGVFRVSLVFLGSVFMAMLLDLLIPL
jgi:protoheme IX farnesyltransferase